MVLVLYPRMERNLPNARVAISFITALFLYGCLLLVFSLLLVLVVSIVEEEVSCEVFFGELNDRTEVLGTTTTPFFSSFSWLQMIEQNREE
jgi:hypothetical protein